MGSLPTTNPVLVGHRWKEYHEVLGLKYIVDSSWETVLKEKPDLIHLLDFPYNGETRRKELMESKVTSNRQHLYAVFWLPFYDCAMPMTNLGLLYSSVDLLLSIRNHGGVPDISADAYELEIGGLVNMPVKLSLKDLQDPNKFLYVSAYTLALSSLILPMFSL